MPFPVRLFPTVGANTARAKKQNGRTTLDDPTKITVLYNANVAEADCWTWWKIACCYFGSMDRNRSYLYVRENSIEANLAVRRCGCCPDCVKCGRCCEQAVDNVRSP